MSQNIPEDIEVVARRAMDGLYAAMRERGVTTTMPYDFGIPLVADALRRERAARREGAEAGLLTAEFQFNRDATMALRRIADAHGLSLSPGSFRGVEGSGFMFTWTTRPRPAEPDRATESERDRLVRERDAARDALHDLTCPRHIDDWHEDHGDALWWKFPVEEAPYAGSPLDNDWPGYHTHWTPIPVPTLPADRPGEKGEGL